MQALTITTTNTKSYAAHAVEIVERKGIGHPDTICDALAEELSQALSRFYLDRFGLVMHHNVDKALLWGGISQPTFGGGKILAPMEIFLAGRATCDYQGIQVPIEDLVQESCVNWLRSHFHNLDPEKHVKIHSLIRPGSPDLVDLYLRQQKLGIALANDTSCGVGYAPLSELERVVLKVEKHLNSAVIKTAHPETGEDIKIMGVRRGDVLQLTVACAFIDRYITNTDDYVSKKNKFATLVEQVAKIGSIQDVTVTVNAADDIETGSLYLTVTGSSAESGDDGEVGRGNRVNGVIAPYRPMNMEAAAGKNPVTHVGKLYNIIAMQIADALITEFTEVREAYCYLVSRIGCPINEPYVVDLRLAMQDNMAIASIKSRIEALVQDELSSTTRIQKELVDGSIRVY